jgi:hypothetical protein
MFSFAGGSIAQRDTGASMPHKAELPLLVVNLMDRRILPPIVAVNKPQ